VTPTVSSRGAAEKRNNRQGKGHVQQLAATRTHFTTLAGAALIAVPLATPAAAEEISLRAPDLVSTHAHLTALEREFYDGLAEATGLDISVNFNPLDVPGVNMQVVRAGTFGIVETTIGSASRDDPFLEGIDLIGVSPDIETLETVVDAYRDVFSTRAAERFNAHVLTFWPFGPQIFCCAGDVKGIADMEGLRVRSCTLTMSALVKSFGLTPVTLQFAEVYPAPQRGVAEFAITSPTSGNTGNWPEVTDSLFMLSISWSRPCRSVCKSLPHRGALRFCGALCADHGDGGSGAVR